MGLSQKEASHQIGIDQGTLARWERGEREPSGKHLERVKHFLTDAEGQAAAKRRAG
jgi:transcriptional regulator with XRE-family HTH domain